MLLSMQASEDDMRSLMFCDFLNPDAVSSLKNRLLNYNIFYT